MFWDNWKLVSPNRSPYLDFISLGSARCSNMEMQWMRCAENVGFSNTKKYCEDLHEDYLECLWNVKTVSYHLRDS